MRYFNILRKQKFAAVTKQAIQNRWYTRNRTHELQKGAFVKPIE